jgi:hypothetical protein
MSTVFGKTPEQLHQLFEVIIEIVGVAEAAGVVESLQCQWHAQS